MDTLGHTHWGQKGAGAEHYLPDWPHVGKQRCGQSCRRRLRSLWDRSLKGDGAEVGGEHRF